MAPPSYASEKSSPQDPKGEELSYEDFNKLTPVEQAVYTARCLRLDREATKQRLAGTDDDKSLATLKHGLHDQPSYIRRLWHLHINPRSKQRPFPKLPITSPSRLTASDEKTILYLAYGSNLCAETFRGTRGIKPLSAINVHVPSLSLTFDLPGIPYSEPCFANTAYRTPSQTNTPYHKDHWTKGLIGVVYEVTPEDYRTIIATEGGGASYHDVIVPCYALPKNTPTVSPTPSGEPILAHTLLSPRVEEAMRTTCPIVGTKTTAGPRRPDPSYAQPSARYLNLITTGAEEHSLPAEYMAYLYSLRPYTITTRKQKVGKGIFLSIWLPVVLALFGIGKLFADEEGRVPAWFVGIMELVFSAVWRSYDTVFKGMFGDGERTIGDEDGDEGLEKGFSTGWSGERGAIRLEDDEKM